LVPGYSYAQAESTVPPKPEIGSVDIAISGAIGKDEIRAQLMTQPTPWSVWIFLNENISSSIGSPRRFYDPLLFYNDINHLRNYLRDNGYFDAIIDTSTAVDDAGKYVSITLNIDEGYRSKIDSIVIDGLDSLGKKKEQLFAESLITRGMNFSRDEVFREQNRILQFLRESGFPEAELDSSSLKRYASTGNIRMYLRYATGREIKFGDIKFPADQNQIDEDIIYQQLDFAKGDIYNEEKRVSSEQNLNRLGLFETVSVRPLFNEVENDSLTSYVPIQVLYRTSDLHEITPEFLVLSDNNDLFSTGLGLGYKHRNFLGGARNFSITAHGRVNRLQDLDFLRVLSTGLSEPTLFTKADIQSQMIFPYFYSNKTKASITLTIAAEKQPEYMLKTIRGQIGFSTKLATYTVGNTEFNIERVDPKIITSSANLRVEDTTKQFNFIEAFTLQRDKTNNIFSPTSGFFHSASVEEAGVVSRAVGGFSLPFSEYYKISLLAKHYFGGEITHTHVFAAKLKMGLAQLYNPANSTPVPLPRRFFAGGSQSVRAWRDKSLSAFGDGNIGGNVLLEGSFESRLQLFPNDGKFLFLNLENMWSVFFLDYGNVWSGLRDVKTRDIAMAVGIGFRYETFVGPIRFDVAWRLYDPQKPRGQQWLYEQDVLRNSYSILNIGIGHAF